jgi:hypothetical protein
MNDTAIYRWTAWGGLAMMGLFFIEFPIYFLRGSMPSVTGTDLCAYSVRNAGNMLTVVFLDMLIYALFPVFLAGIFHFIRRVNPQREWLGVVALCAGVAYMVLTLLADSFEGTIALDARTGHPDGILIRTLMEIQYLLFGSIGLILIAVLMVALSAASVSASGFPRWMAWLGHGGAFLCLAFVPSMFAGAPDLTAFYNPAGWGTTGVIAGFPLAIWMIAACVLLLKRVRDLRFVAPAS